MPNEWKIPEEAWEAAREVAAVTGFSKRVGEIAARIAEAMRKRDRRVMGEDIEELAAFTESERRRSEGGR